MRNNFLATAALGLGFISGSTLAQSTAFEDAATGITFQQRTEGDYTFGIAMPATATGDFIGRISGQGTEGYAAISLAGSMQGSLMVVTWPNDGAVVGSLRLATGYSNPGVYSGSATLETISTGTSFDAATSTYTYTFLCKGCLQGDSSTFATAATTATPGWARSSVAVTSPADPSTTISFHDAGFGLFAVDLAAAQSASFAEWAALAGGSTSTPPVGGGVTNGTTNGTTNSTTPVTISNSTYDYIVIGGGPSGLVSSQRLTETGKSVLLIERGMATTISSGGKRITPWNDDSLTYYDVPGLTNAMADGTQGEAYCSDTAQMAGCALGGGGSINGMAFVYPRAADFDDKWPETWKWDDLKASAERLYARNPGTTSPSVDGKNYDNGTITVMEPFFEANGWTYVDYIEDPESKSRAYGQSAYNVRDGLRSGPIHTYLPLAEAKETFTLALNTKVIRVLRNASTITGVEVENETGRQIINLSSEGGAVLLAAGSMSTPRLLFNSGIGPAEQINIVKSSSTGVQVPESEWIDLPVGLEIKDHSSRRILFKVKEGLTPYNDTQFTSPSAEDLALFEAGSGPLTIGNQRLDIFTEYTTSDGTTIAFQAHLMTSGLKDTVVFASIMTHGLTSSGVLGIRADQSTVFTTEPWANTDTDKEAWELYITDILEQTRKPGSPIEYSGGANVTAADVIAELPIRNGFHVMGSAKMGSDDGRDGGTAVVDLDTKVYGTDNLFVVDASFHPDLPTGNTQVPIMIAAERAVERIIALRGDTSSSQTSKCKRRV